MKTHMLLLLLFITLFQMPLMAQEADTAFPTIENNPNIPLDLTVEAEPDPDPDNMKPKKHDNTKVEIGSSQSFFTDIIMGISVLGIGVLVWLGYRFWKNKQLDK